MSVYTQFFSYVAIGLISNTILYILYIFLTQLGLGPKLSMSVLYCIGVLQTFIFNKNLTFRFAGAVTPALIRYAIAYLVGYIVNFCALILLVDLMGLPHQYVQAAMILIVAFILFCALRYWVFYKSI